MEKQQAVQHCGNIRTSDEVALNTSDCHWFFSTVVRLCCGSPVTTPKANLPQVDLETFHVEVVSSLKPPLLQVIRVLLSPQVGEETSVLELVSTLTVPLLQVIRVSLLLLWAHP